MENSLVNPLNPPSSANASVHEVDTTDNAAADSRHISQCGGDEQQSNHKPPKITFSENSSSLIRCMPNDRATFFVKIDTVEDDADILPLDFEWSRGDVSIYNSDRFRITKTSNAVQLAVEHVQREDAGHYTLFAKTKSNDVIRKDVQLIVEDRSTGEDPPKFARRLKDLQVRVGSSTRLITEIRSSTDVKLTWFRNDRRICPNDRIKEVYEGLFYYIEINPVTLEDGGQWMVMAENYGGRNSCISNLTVIVPKAYKAPEFIEELKAILTQQGTVSLECKVVGVPTPQLRWFKDSKEIKAGDVFALTANADDPTSLGTYTCEAVNCVGKSYSSSKLHVVGRGSREGSLKPADSVINSAPPPIFTNELKNASVRIGDTIILGCQVAVPPWPQSVVWYNKNGRVDTGDRYKYIEDGLGVYMIEVKPSEASDEGEWKCVVTNEEGCVGISSCAVDMEIPKNYRKPRFMENLRAVLTEEGLVSFECKVVGFPTPQLKWFKDGQELKPGDVYQLTGTNSLGTYCCIAQNCMGETSSIAVLTVEDIQNQLNDEERLTIAASTSQPPKFLLGLKSQETKINEPFQFTVKVEATPEPLLSWFRDELPIETNERYNQYRGEEDNCHLDIRCVQFIDQAEWKCVAVNDFGTTVTSCFLKLQIPRHYKKPRFLECLRAVLTEEGAVNLECKVIGVPQPMLKWYKDGVELKPGDIHKIISGQDGTCCLGTYTCEARNCMGVVASSAALLGFEDDYSKQENPQQNELQRNFSLSTIQEEHTSQLYETPQGDITVTDRGDVSFSFDGKEVSVSLYETPDLTEEEALKIVEMYADQISEHVTEQNIVELPPLRFVKETSQSGKLLMEAVVIDISPEYFTHDEDLRTEAGMDDISINEITIHESSVKGEEEFDKQTNDFARNSFEKMEEELSLAAPIRKRKKSKPNENDEFISCSKTSDGSVDENTSELQTFASAQMSKIESLENESISESIQAPERKKNKKQTDSESSKTTEHEAQLQDISGAVGDGLKVTSDKPLKVVSNEVEIEKNLKSLLPLAKVLKVLEGHLNAVESEVINQSVMLMTPASADQSIAIIKNIIDPISQIQSKLKVYSGETPLDALFETMNGDIRNLHVALQVIEKCVEIDETGTTLIQRTSVCIIDSIADHLVKALEEVKTITESFENESLKSHLQLTVDDIKQGLEITKDTIKSQALLQEAQEIEATKHFTETVAKLQEIPESLPFAKVAEANLPKFSESVKTICEPVLRIQAALEKVENELTLEESDEDIFIKVHEKIMTNLVKPLNDLQAVVAQIDSKVSSMSSTDSVEQKINMAILDIVSAPLFELNKGLEIIQQQPSKNIEAGKLTVHTVESMVPPLQEIQNGLAQLSQDVLTGQITDDHIMDTDDLKKLLQSLAQAVLHLESNIDHITTRLPENVSQNLSQLKENISSLISQVIDKDIDKYHLLVLENIKKPIDELNYCIRQIEQKSISGSLTDLVDPLHSLNDKVKMSQDILKLATTKQNSDIAETLEKMGNLIKHIEIDIEENEFKNLQKEIELDEQQSRKDDHLFSTVRQEMELKIELEESLREMEKLCANIKYLESVPYIDKKLKVQFTHLAKPYEQLIAVLQGNETLQANKNCLQSSLNILSQTARATKAVNSSLEKLQIVKNESEFLKVFQGNCRNDLEQLKISIDQMEDYDVTAGPVVNAFNKILVVLENILPKLVAETIKEDISTLEDVSALKSAAESLPPDSERTTMQKEVAGPLKSFEEKKIQVEELLGQLKNSIASVLAHCNDYDMGSLRTEAVEQMKATVNKMEDFKQCLEQTLQPHVLDVVHTTSESTDPRTMAEAVCSLENCALQIQEYIDNFDVKDLSSDEISELKTMARPLKDLVEGVKVFYTQELEQVETMNTLSQASMSSAKVLQSLRPYVLAVLDNQALETLESLANSETFSHLKEFVQPLRELEKAVICTEENKLLSQISSLSDQTSLEILKTYAEPLLSLKEAIINVKQEQAYNALEECPLFQVVREKSNVLFNLLKYCESFDGQIFENIEDLSSLGISNIQSYAELNPASEVEFQVPITTHPQQVKTFDLKDCVAGGIKQIEECLHTTKSIQDIEVTSLENIMQQLKQDLQSMESNLLKTSEKTEDLVQKETKVAKTMFKLKECLVHTYESADLETGLEDIEKTFEDLLQAMPSLELQLALEMKEKIVLGFSEFIVACLETSDQQNVDILIQPIRDLMATVEAISTSNEVEVEISSSVMIQLQTQLMTAFRALNELGEKSENEMLPVLLKTQNKLVSIYDFIENNEGNLRIIELLQEIDCLTPELRELKTILLLAKHRTSEEQRRVLLENVNSAQLFLTEIHEGLLLNSPLVHAFMQENQETVEKLKNTLSAVENKLHSKTDYDMEQEETICILSDLLKELKANVEKIKTTEIKTSTKEEETHMQSENVAEQETVETEQIETKKAEDEADLVSSQTIETSQVELATEQIKPTPKTSKLDTSDKKDKQKDSGTTKKQPDPFLADVLQLIQNTQHYIHTLPTSNVKQSTSAFVKAVTDNLEVLKSAVEVDSPAALEDRLFLPLFKSKELINYAMCSESSDEITDNILQNHKLIVLKIINGNDKLRKALLYDVVEALKPNLSNISKHISGDHKKSDILQNLSLSTDQIISEINKIYQHNQGDLTQSSQSFKALEEALCQLQKVTEEISAIKPNVLKTAKLNRLLEKLKQNEVNDAFEILLEMENIKEIFDQLLEIIKTEPRLLQNYTEQTIRNVLRKLEDNDDLRELNDDLQETLKSSDNELKRKCIFKLREHIVHTYDGSLRNDIENLIDAIMENNSDLIESINTDFLRNVKDNISSVNLQIDSVAHEPWQTKLTGLTSKLLNLQSIAERLQANKDVEKSSGNMIELQKNLMDIFVLFDDMIDIKTPNIHLDLEKVKSLSLKQYDSIENSTDKIKTLKVYEDIIDLCTSMCQIVEKVAELSKSQQEKEKDIEKNKQKAKLSKVKFEELEDQPNKAEERTAKGRAEILEVKEEVVTKKSQEKDDTATKEREEITEIYAEKLEEEQIVTDARKAEAFRADKKKPEVSETQAETLEAKAADTEARKVKDEVIKASAENDTISEVKAEKIERKEFDIEEIQVKEEEKQAKIAEPKAEAIEEKKPEPDAKKVEYKDIKVVKENIEMSEIKPEKIEETEFVTEAKKAKEENIKANKEKPEISDVKVEKIEDKKLDTEAKKIEETDVKAAVSEVQVEISEVQVERIEEKRIDTKVQKAKGDNIEATKAKAEISEVKAEKIEEKKFNTETIKAKEEDIKDARGKAKIAELEPENIEKKKLESEANKVQEENVNAAKQKAEVSEIKAEQIKEDELDTGTKKSKIQKVKTEAIEEMTLDSAAKKAEEEDVKAAKEKAELSEVKAEKIEEKKLEPEAKKVEQENVMAVQQKGEVSEVVAEKIEERKQDAQPKKAKEENYKAAEERAEISEVKAEKIEEVKQDTTAKKLEKKDVKAAEEIAEISDVQAKNVEEKRMETETMKSDEENIKAPKDKAKISEIKAEAIEEMTLDSAAKKTEQKDVKASKEKPEISEVKAEKIEQKKVQPEAKKVEQESVTAAKQKGEVSEIIAEKIEEHKQDIQLNKAKEENIKAAEESAEISEVKAEKIEEVKQDAAAKKLEKKDVKAANEKAEVSEVQPEKIEEKGIETETSKKSVKVKAEKIEEVKLDSAAKKLKKEDVKSAKEKANLSEVQAEKIEEHKLDTETKKAKEENIKAAEKKAEILEVKAEKIKEIKLDSAAKTVEKEDSEAPKEKAAMSEVQAEKIEEHKLDTETKTKKATEENIKATKENAETSEVKAEKIEKFELDPGTKQVEMEVSRDAKQKAEISEVQAEKIEERKPHSAANILQKEDVEATKQKAEISEVKAEKIKEKKLDPQIKIAKDEQVLAAKEKAEISEIRAEKIEESGLGTEPNKVKEENIEASKEKAEISQVKAVKIEEKILATETKKAKEDDIEPAKRKGEYLEVKKIEENKLDTEAKKAKEINMKAAKEKAEMSEVHVEKLEDRKLDPETKKVEEKDVKATKEKAKEENNVDTESKKAKEENTKASKDKPEILELKTENIEKKKLDSKSKKVEEEDLKAAQQKAEISDVKIEKIEEKRVDTTTKRAKKETIKDSKEIAEISEVKAKKIEEKKIDTQAIKIEEEDVEAAKEMAKISQVQSEKIEEKKVDTETKKVKEDNIKASKAEAKISEVKAEQIEEKKLDTETTKIEEKEVMAAKEKAKISEIHTEKMEEKRVDTETKKVKEENTKASKEKAEISKVKAEKIEEEKLVVDERKTKQEDIQADKKKAEISEVKAEKIEEDKLVVEDRKTKQEDIQAVKKKAEISKVKAEKIEEKKIDTEAKKAEENNIKDSSLSAEVSELRDEMREEKELDAMAIKSKEEDIKTAKEKAEISEEKSKKIEEKKLGDEVKNIKEEETAKENKIEEIEEKKSDSKENLDRRKGDTDAHKVKDKAKISKKKEVDSKENKFEEESVKTVKEETRTTEVEKKIDARANIVKEENDQADKETADILETKAEKLEQKKQDIESKKNKEEDAKEEPEIEKAKAKKIEKKKIEQKNLKESKEMSEMSAVKAETDGRSNNAKDEYISAAKENAEIMEDRWTEKVKEKKLYTESKILKDTNINAANKNIEAETEMEARIIQREVHDKNLMAEEKPKRSKDYMDLREQRSAKRMPCVDIKLTNRNSSVGSDLKLTCGISGNDLVVRWYKDNVAIENSSKYKITQKDGLCSLEIKAAELHDAAVYRCVAANRNGEVETSCLVTMYDVPTNKYGTPPIFTRNIRDTYHSHENHITLECKVSGQPKPKIYWQKDNTLLSEEGKYKHIDLQDGIRQLIIQNPSKEDTGLYTCYAESESGQMKISKFVDISDYMKKITERRASKIHIEYPKEEQQEQVRDKLDGGERQEQKLRTRDMKFKLNVETPMKPMTIASGTKAQLICYVSGLIEDVYWLRGNERVTKDSRHKIYNINGALSLEIYDVRPDDSAVYKCVVRNNRNSIESVCDLTVYDSSTAELPSSFSSPVTATFDAARCEMIFTCNVHCRPTVTWIRDDHTISNNRYRIVEDIGGVRKLIIRNPIPSDCGTFSCFAETNEQIESIIKIIRIADLKKLMTAAVEPETNGFVNVSEDTNKYVSATRESYKNDLVTRSSTGRNLDVSAQRKPLFSTLLHDRTVTECSNVRLSCSVVYDGCTSIEWLKDNGPLPKDNRYQTIFHNGEAILEIFNAQESDSGRYVCHATNDYGESISQSQLRIYKHYEDAPQAATFVQSIKDTYSINENELVLECRVRGKPRPEIQWMKGTDLLMPGEKYAQMDQTDGYSKLIISNPTEKDSGMYACVARNAAAENKITHQVDFKGRERFAMEKTMGFFHRDPNKPHFVAPLGNQTVCNGGTIAITAEFMQTHTPIEVQWLRDRKSLAGQPNVKTFYERGVYTLAIMNAEAEHEGTYTCRAQNAFGRIESHATVDVAVGVEKDERPPLFLSRPETEMKIAVGDPFSISFRIAGDPKPRLTFMKGTKDITKSDRVSKEVSDDFTRFSVQKSQISDSGTYFVVARNNNGTDRIFVTVEVMPRARSETPTGPRWGLALECYPDVSYFKDPPAAISTEPLLIDSGPTHISLSWGKPPTNNSAPVIAYRVDVWVVGHDGGAMWKELGLTPINSFDAFNLKPNVDYHFRVTPKNRYGWGPAVQTSAPLQVGGIECLPEFTVILPGQIKALLNREFVLEAVVRGTPRPEIVWYKDGLRISSNVESERIKTRKIGSTCSLTIKQVTENDAGRYTCEATNSKGRVSTFARLQVVSDPKLYEADNRLKEIVRQDNMSYTGDTLPIFTMRLRDRRVQVTYPVRLTCQVVGHPKPEITWFKDDELLQSSRRCLLSEEHQFYTLELASAQLNDSGTYTCTAKNELGSVSCHCSLVVDKGIRAYISPEFYMPLDPLYIVQEGQELRLTAKVEAYPAVGVSWHRNGVKLRPSRRLACSLDANGLVALIISEANIRDAGIYTCVASNAVGKQESICRVCIEPLEEDAVQRQTTRTVPAIRTNDMPYSKEPLFVVKPRSSEAYEGDTVIIFCEVVGDPKPDVVWLRDFLKPEYYRDAPHFRRIGEGPEYRLEIPYAKLDFTGTYSIIATNCHGETKAVISLQIFAKDILKQNPMEKGSIRHGNVETLPRFLRHLRNLRCCDGDAITLEAHVEGLPEPVIIWEKDGRVLPSDKDFEMTYDGIKATLSIPRVYPEDEGEYTCIAKNNIGRTLSSACIIVDVPEEKENMLNRQLTRPTGFLSASSTPLSTPRSTPIRSISPTRGLSYRNSIIDISEGHSSSSGSRCLIDGRQAISAPKFLAIPNSRVVEEGDSVRFQCAIAGHPMPWSTWDKDGIIVTPTTRIAVKEVNDLRYLEIEEVTFEDAGLYRITLENDYGRIEATARLDVISSSRFSKSPSARSVHASSSKRSGFLHRRIMGPSTAIGGRMALAAGFRGSSVPSCKFYHNGVELQVNERINIDLLQEEAFLFVDKVTKDDEGIYTCVIEGHEHEPIVTSTVVTFLANDQSDHPPKTICEIIQPLPNEIEHWEGDTIDLCFELKCNMPYTYMWSRNGELIKESDDFNYIDHGNGFLCLRIHDAFDLDSGCYNCIVTTVDGFQCSTFTNLNIGRKTEIIDDDTACLAVMKSILPVVADCGVKASFCARIFPTDAQVVWYVCGRMVMVENVNDDDSGQEYSLESSSTDGLRILHINNVTLAHSGEVQLVVTHPGKPHSTLKSYTTLAVIPRTAATTATTLIDKSTKIPTNLKIDVSNSHKNKERFQQLPAYILEGPSDCTALIGGCVRLSVIFEGIPKPQVRWFKASRPIVETSNIIINTSSRKSILQISDIVTDDSGKYTVEVMNEFGTDVAVASVAVEGPPEPPSGKPSISQGPDRVSIAWCGPPYDGGCMITGFIIEMQELLSASDSENEAAWLEIASVVDSLAYTVKNLKPLCSYRFRVRAENVHGRSEPGSPSDRVHINEENDELTEDFQKPISIKAGGEFKERFEILEELGKGRFGVVFKVQEKEEPKRICAAKIIKCIKSRDRVKVQEEISIMKSLKHPKLLQLAASFESSREIVMVMEYITGGELFERVVADDFTLTERDCILFVRQVCEGVAYMHSQSIVHLDLKPENIMCKTRTCHQIKIIDFGLAQRLNTGSPVRVLFGTPEFIPPEIISYEPIGFQSDMWSVGVICYVLLSGLSPFMGDSDVETFSNITRADYDFDDDAFDCVSQQAKDFISNLLVHRKENRWTAEQCLESPWLKQGHYDENMGNKKICTDKLKKFIIRRKWQKTGNAIRALGRMATLSASRRNSVASNTGSVPNSPRPSISGISMFNPNIAVHMGSLHEEDDDFSIELPSTDIRRKNPKVLNKSQCSERSDSGYSDCSNCSASGSMQCQCVSVKDSVDHMSSDDLSSSVPHDLLKLKLEEIAHQADSNIEEAKLELVVPTDKCLQLDDNQNEIKTLKILNTEEQTVQVVEELDVLNKELTPSASPIMRSDFTNTIQMRKKSLENSLQKDKQLKPVSKSILFEQPGKVNMLKNKFSCLQSDVSIMTTTSSFAKSKDCMDVLKLKRKVITEACSNRTSSLTSSSSSLHTSYSTSLPNSPIPLRKTNNACSTFRLSDRVREVTDRLAQQQTVCTEARRTQKSPSPIRKRILSP